LVRDMNTCGQHSTLFELPELAQECKKPSYEWNPIW